jgi:superfamily I DNA and/or RNA helicase
MTEELERVSKEAFMSKSGQQPEGTEENNEKNSVRIASDSVCIQIKHLPNTSLQYYRYNNVLGVTIGHVNMQKGNKLSGEKS